MTYFSPYLYNRVYSELTNRNSFSRQRLACLRLNAHIEPTTEFGGAEIASTGKCKYGKVKYKVAKCVRVESTSTENSSTATQGWKMQVWKNRV